MPSRGPSRAPGWRRIAPALLLSLSLLAVPCATRAAEPGLAEKILENKYRRGDYGFYLGWHDPEDWQFDEHGSFAIPFGLKVRFRWLEWLRVEGDVSYYRRGEDPPVIVSLFEAPNFDGLLLGGVLQYVPRRTGWARPYVGAGPIFASLGNDFAVFRPDVAEADPGNPDQFALAHWSQIDLGVQVQAGVDLFPGHRFFPFAEYRHLFGQLELDDDDVTIGTFPFEPEELHTVPDRSTNPDDQGRPHSRKYDWSGPLIQAGLKVRF